MGAAIGTVDDGKTIGRLTAEFGFDSVDFVFIDHYQPCCLPDLLLQGAGLLHPGTVVVADNVKIPGAPKYLAHMREREG